MNLRERVVPHPSSRMQILQSKRCDRHAALVGWPCLGVSSSWRRHPAVQGWGWRCPRWKRHFFWWWSARWPVCYMALPLRSSTPWPRSRTQTHKGPQNILDARTTAEGPWGWWSWRKWFCCTFQDKVRWWWKKLGHRRRKFSSIWLICHTESVFVFHICNW